MAEIQAKSLGMAVEIFDSDGKNIEDTATPGELVCTRPHPSMPVYFWADKNDEKYRNAYFKRYPGEFPLSMRDGESLTAGGWWQECGIMATSS